MKANREQAVALFQAGERDFLTLQLLIETGRAPHESVGFHTQQACENGRQESPMMRIMQIIIEIPQQLPDIMHCSPGDFEKQAKMAMVAKLYEMGKVSSGMAAQMAGMACVEFLVQLGQYGVAMIDLDKDELQADLENA